MKFLFLLLILLLPTQLGKHWWPEWSLVNGIRIDYLAPTLYATDLLLIAIVMFGHVIPLSGKRGCEKKLLLIKVISFLGMWGAWGMWIIFRSERPILAAYWMARYLETGVMAWVISKYKIENKKYKIEYLLAIGIVFLVGLEIAQIILGRTTGWFWWLGERSFAINTPGVATIGIWGREILRPYATFGHPNALAGYLAVAGILIGYKKISFLGVVLTGSRTVIAAIAIGMLGPSFAKATEGKGVILFAPRAVEERMILNKAGWEMFKNNWLWGVGPGQFLAQLPKYLPAYERGLQPAHNVFLLLLAEFGVVGGGMGVISVIKVIKIITRNQKNKEIIGRNQENKEMAVLGTVILITALFDHYWVTSQQNRLLLGLTIGLLIAKTKNQAGLTFFWGEMIRRRARSSPSEKLATSGRSASSR